ncbi:MAG: hypothetical protein ABSF70_11075 [Terracidiphilus sp.]|jgi:hypothetical protein
MRFKLFFGLVLALLFVCAARPILAQVVAPATVTRIPLSVGAGVSDFNPEALNPGRILGGTLWIDVGLPHMPSILRGLGIEAEARDLSFGASSSEHPGLKEESAEGGLIYSWPHYQNLRPYAKFLAGYGNLDQELVVPVPHHDSRDFTCIGGGVDYKLFGRVWVRAEYELQRWPDMAFHDIVKGVPVPYAPRYPQGASIGAMYHFGSHHYSQ